MLQQSHSVFCYQKHFHIYSSLLSFVYVSIFIFSHPPLFRNAFSFVSLRSIFSPSSVHTTERSRAKKKEKKEAAYYSYAVRSVLVCDDGCWMRIFHSQCLRFACFFSCILGLVGRTFREWEGMREQNFFRGWMIWRDIQYFFHIIFFIHFFSSFHCYEPTIEATGMNKKKRWKTKKKNWKNEMSRREKREKFCYRVCQNSFSNCGWWICVISLFLFAILCCASSTTTSQKRDERRVNGTDTQPKKADIKTLYFVRDDDDERK